MNANEDGDHLNLYEELGMPSIGNCVVILRRGGDGEPGPEILNARGHVGFYAGHDGDFVHVLGGNQGDSVSVARFPIDRVLGIRRLA